MKKQLILISVFILLVLPMVLADISDLGEFKQDSCVNIRQTCASCSYVNITIARPDNNTAMLTNQPMVSDGGASWNYVTCNTTILGRYDVNGFGDINGVKTGFDVLYFNVTPSGQGGSTNIIFIIILIVILYTVAFIGFFGKNIPISILGGMAMLGLGVYLISQGIIIYRDWFTNYFAYVTIGLGGIFALWAIVEWIEGIKTPNKSFNRNADKTPASG